jgi:hypothetical protein
MHPAAEAHHRYATTATTTATAFQQVRFHQHHPEYEFIAAAGDDGSSTAAAAAAADMCSPNTNANSSTMATAAGHPRSPTGLHRGNGNSSSAAGGSDGAHDSQAALDHTRAIAVVGRLLGLQSSLLAVQRQAFLVLARGSLDAQVTTRALFLPLIDEVSALSAAALEALLLLRLCDSAGTLSECSTLPPLCCKL